MPAHPKTTDDEIVRATLGLIEQKGREGFSMSDVAAAVGVRTPSLYSRFKDRNGLLVACEIQLCAQIGRVLRKAIVPDKPEVTLMAQAHALRRYAKRNPNSFTLLFDHRSVPTDEGTEARRAALHPMMPALTALAGERGAFQAARVLVPFLYGFVSMELANAFRLAGGVDEAFARGVSVVLRGVKAS